ncbi:MAG: malto-oligosyltrehalose synthase [Polycyclovorans sp.]|jgi:(1->4)-alpha-D-glucan 1-alpha-D-glucosylmutase|nr:malto-oligosyltrehalose synthase [Polycyclovorans sp.]
MHQVLDSVALTAAATAPLATMRVQLHQGFDFAAVTEWVPYFRTLGISHLFVSPILAAIPGSQHCYDVIDHARVNPELGGEAGLRDLVAALRRHGMGLIVDIVPNHMAIGHVSNRRWLQVLEWGERSDAATFFDIDWDRSDPGPQRRIHLPFLGRPYGDALAAGELKLCFDREDGRFYVAYHRHRFPLTVQNYSSLLREAGLADLAVPFDGLAVQPEDRSSRSTFNAGRASLKGATGAHATLMQFLDRFHVNAGQLHDLLEQQHYRLAWWRTAADQINWRRFFDVNELAGVRVEDPRVFEEVHATIFRLYREGLIDGLRVDHIDGLADPRAYCRRLRARLKDLQSSRPRGSPTGAAYIVVEKILAPHEQLRRGWQTDGTSGYAFMNDVGALLHDHRGEATLNELWLGLSGGREYGEEERSARRQIASELFASELRACAQAFSELAGQDPRWRDWSEGAFHRVLTEILTHFPTYRIYVDARGRSAADSAVMKHVVSASLATCRPGERALVTLIDRWLDGDETAKLAYPRSADAVRRRAVQRFQQLTAPIAAKAVEDTAFYRHARLMSRNEVGAHPEQFSICRWDFHRANLQRQQRHPQTLLATATHDHKRGEDVRTRLAVLSEYPQLWAEAVSHWRRRNGLRRFNEEDCSHAPDDIDEYMLYQMLVGCWPAGMAADDRAALAAFRDRLQHWQRKAIREGKRHSSWTDPDEAYEKACALFLTTLLDADHSRDFLASVQTFVALIAPAGAVKSLSQVLLKMSTPGVPDFYQGTEWWDLSMVDPDNRRAVDFAARAQALARQDKDDDACLHDWATGKVKQRLISRVLRARNEDPELFTSGRYQPLNLRGPLLDRFLAFARTCGSRCMIIVVPRFLCGVLPLGQDLRLNADVLTGNYLQVPDGFEQRRWRNVVDPQAHIEATGALPLRAILAKWPVGVLLAGPTP